MILLIDNYDSFTYNLVHYLKELGADVVVKRNDAITVSDAKKMKPKAIVISPGPCDPDKAGICLDLIKEVSGKIPLLGVCLGHQAIAQVFGGKVVRAPKPMHGKISIVKNKGEGIFKGLPKKFAATRYHSLIADKKTFSKDLKVTAETDDGIIMGLAHKKYNVHGVQFHPESIATEHGHEILGNFLDLAKVKRKKQK